MNDQPVFVLSAGRSGSTLLQKLLNSSQELVIWGEHMGILRHLARAMDDIKRTPWINESPTGTWML